LKRELTVRGWNQQDLSRASGISPVTVSHAASGFPISVVTLRAFAKALIATPPLAGLEKLLP
jgi:transcriptional regulator with XRE-family HTH domain